MVNKLGYIIYLLYICPMKNLFVPYEIAVKLKEKGFNEPCLASYEKVDNKIEFNIINSPFQVKADAIWLAPLYQQVVDWLRIKHKIGVNIIENDTFFITEMKKKGHNPPQYLGFITDQPISTNLDGYNKTGGNDYYTVYNNIIEVAIILIKIN